MRRRSFLTTLSALPFFGGFSLKKEPVTPVARLITASEIRDREERAMQRITGKFEVLGFEAKNGLVTRIFTADDFR